MAVAPVLVLAFSLLVEMAVGAESAAGLVPALEMETASAAAPTLLRVMVPAMAPAMAMVTGLDHRSALAMAMVMPTPSAIRKARAASGLSQSESARLVGVSARAWQYWESGHRAMSAASFELFLIKTGQAPKDAEKS